MRRFHRSATRVAVAVAALAFLVAPAGCGDAGQTISGEELAKRIAEGDAPVVLDVRSPEEYAAGHIPGAVNIPFDQLADRIAEVPAKPGDEVVVHCQTGRRAEKAESVLAEAGYTRVRDLAGHIAGWKEANHPIE